MISAAAYDSDAQAFFTAAGITDSTQKSAVNQLVLDLKSYSLWTKFIAIYPLVGGTSTTHKYNLVDPQDTDAAFRLVFSGGITHASTGMTGNGSTGYADTFITPSSHMTQNDVCAFAYCRTNASGSMVAFGSLKTTATANGLQINPRNASDNFTARCQENTLSSVANTDSRGLFGISRQGSTTYSMSKNSTQTSKTTTSTTLNSLKIYLMAINADGAVSTYDSREYAFFAFGTGLTDTECDNLYTAVQAFQTTLSRNV